jgi:uncharacterized membrane protein YphA (DoxX/SURF4 family)
MRTDAEQRVVDTVWWTLRVTLGVVPLVAGIDKFLNLLADWPRYIAPVFQSLIPMSPQSFMYLVGVIEIAAGLAVLTRWTKPAAYVVAGWLTCIAINLIAARFFDIAVRDLVMAVTALSLARLTAVVTVPSVARAHLRPAAAMT